MIKMIERGAAKQKARAQETARSQTGFGISSRGPFAEERVSPRPGFGISSRVPWAEQRVEPEPGFGIGHRVPWADSADNENRIYDLIPEADWVEPKGYSFEMTDAELRGL